MTWRIKIHRKITERERYTNWNVVRLFFHCLLKANHADKNWQWINIDRWSFITSIEHLAIELKLSQQQIRTALTKLENTWELVKKSTNKYTLITLVKYSDYNDWDNEDNKQITNQQQTNNKQITTTKNDKNSKNDKNNNFLSIEEVIETRNWIDWFKKTMKITKEIKKERARVVKEYTVEEFEYAVDQYTQDTKNRAKTNDPKWYDKHRFTFYEFIKQSNWLQKRVNK